MRSLYSSLMILLASAFVLSACSKNYMAQHSEVDDMYFTSKDRKELEASNKVFTENFTDDYEKPLTQDQVEEYSDVNYSSKTINPEYIAKYSSEGLTDEEEPLESGEYFDETYNLPTSTGGTNNYYQRNNYYGGSSFGNPYSVWNNDPWFYGSPYSYRPYRPYGYGSRFSVSLGYTWGSRWGTSWPYSYYNYGYYDPFYRSRLYSMRPYNDWGYGFYDPWAFGNSYSYYGGSFGVGNGWYCPTYVAPTYFNSVDRRVAGRTVTRGPRVARGGPILTGNSGNRDVRGKDQGDGIRITDDGSSAVRDDNASRSRTTARNNYYRRSRSTSSDANVTRGYQRSRTTATPSTLSSTRRRSSTSGYSRTSQSSFRTRSSGNSTRFSSGTRSSSPSKGALIVSSALP